MTTVREATIEDLPRLSAGAEAFYASSITLRTFKLDRFCALWTDLLTKDTGVIFLALEQQEIAGALGGVAYPDPYSDELIATEFFLFVLANSRGGTGMLRLYRSFEHWARNKGCGQIRMGHLADLMPERLKETYLKMGFRHIESHYAKDL